MRTITFSQGFNTDNPDKNILLGFYRDSQLIHAVYINVNELEYKTKLSSTINDWILDSQVPIKVD